MMELKSHTPARIGIGRTGSRYLTKAYLRFRADHAAANDAVMTEVSQKTLERLHLPQVQTRCKDKYEMLTRPDLGRLFDDENKDKIKAILHAEPGCANLLRRRPVRPLYRRQCAGSAAYAHLGTGSRRGSPVGTPFFLCGTAG